MKTRLIKRLSPILSVIPLTSATPLTSCGLNNAWNWEISTKNNSEINYCLLIGQNDHSDSIERTRYTRIALDTYDKEATEKAPNKNANIANPKDGSLTIYSDDKSKSNTFKVKELEHMEQKSMAGATWDPITANGTAGTWIAKHDKKITFFVSNNDSMAEGAYWASNWIKGLPIFSYDANPSTIKLIKSGAITGTVDQNASTQCGAAMMMLRNMIDDKTNNLHEFGKQSYDPLNSGFCTQSEYEKEKSEHPYGYVDKDLITTNTETKVGTKRSILAASTAINANPVNVEGKPKTENNVNNYLKDNGEAKEPKDMFDMLTHINKDVQPTTNGKILMTYNNKAEVYLVSTLKPYFNEYAQRLNLSLDTLEGDGTGEGVVLNQIKAKLGQEFDGFLINMTYTTSADNYVEELAKIACVKEKKDFDGNDWTKWDNKLDTPLIFWNRQPQKDGKPDTNVMNNKYFKYCYFIGVDAAKGGEVQGSMIVNKIAQWYNKKI